MTTYAFSDITAERSARNPLDGLKRLIGLLIRHRLRYRTLQSLAHLDAVQLADIGLDAEDVTDAMNGDGAVLWTKIPRLR